MYEEKASYTFNNREKPRKRETSEVNDLNTDFSLQLTPTKTCENVSQTSVQKTQTDNTLSCTMHDIPKEFRNLIEDGTFDLMLNILAQYDQLKDFESLLRNIASGVIPPDNICWLLNMHLGRLSSVTSTTQMRWNPEIVEFFSIIYILFGASAINVL